MLLRTFGPTALFFLVGFAAGAQERARDAPFFCEPVVASSIVFRGIALESHEPGEGSQQVRFEVEERFVGLASDVKEYVLPLELAEPLRRGEKRIVVEAAKLAPRQNHELAVIYEKEKQKGNANLAT